MANKQKTDKNRIITNPAIKVGKPAVKGTWDASGVKEALDLAGAWSDLDWDDTIAALDRIRHESKPTPPIKL
jgi:hypothetical protein